MQNGAFPFLKMAVNSSDFSKFRCIKLSCLEILTLLISKARYEPAMPVLHVLS